MITVHVITYNEKVMLPLFVKHYRKLFPKCIINVYDNESDDGTPQLAKKLGCEIFTYKTNGKLSDLAYLEIKNNWWKEDKTDWHLVVDCDEFVQISEAQLKKEKATVIRFETYNMIGLPDSTKGIRAPMYDKKFLFRGLKEINYEAGCHVAKPIGEIIESKHLYKCFHYKYISASYLVDRYKNFQKRLSYENKRNGWGSQYSLAEQAIKEEFSLAEKRAIEVNTQPEEKKLQVFVLGFDEKHALNNSEHITNINLTNISSRNELSEHRFFISNPTLQADFIGIASWRWHQKAKHLISLNDLSKLELKEDTVWYAWGAKDWYRESTRDHRGLNKYLDELISYTGLEKGMKSFYANQVICSRKVFKDFLENFNMWFEYFDNKYGTDYNFQVLPKDKPRTPACFYERFSTLYFANRKDLILKQIPFK